jgi:hypothetical protein
MALRTASNTSTPDCTNVAVTSVHAVKVVPIAPPIAVMNASNTLFFTSLFFVFGYKNLSQRSIYLAPKKLKKKKNLS